MQRDQRMVQKGGTKHTFAATPEREEAMGTKVCPRCGETLFADMDVCYGCLYDFSRDEAGRAKQRQAEPPLTEVTKPIAIPGGADPLAAIELDEIDDEPPSEPRHSRKDEVGSADDTFDLAAVSKELSAAPDKQPLSVLVESEDLRVCVPLPAQGIVVGRGDASDILLKARSVSRRHLRLVPCGEKVLVEDCGATNPALVDGVPLEGSAVLGVGAQVDVCGTVLKIGCPSTD